MKRLTGRDSNGSVYVIGINGEHFDLLPGRDFPSNPTLQERLAAYEDAGVEPEDVRPASLLEQIKWERDTALTQLAEIGKGLGEKMDDVRPAVKAQWICVANGFGVCSNCHRADHIDQLAGFCRYCGAIMTEQV